MPETAEIPIFLLCGGQGSRLGEVAAQRFGSGTWRVAARDLAVEVPTLLLSSEQARRWLGWRPRLATEQAVHWAVDGYRALLRERDAGWLVEQIQAYDALDQGPRPAEFVPWPRIKRLQAYA